MSPSLLPPRLTLTGGAAASHPGQDNGQEHGMYLLETNDSNRDVHMAWLRAEGLNPDWMSDDGIEVRAITLPTYAITYFEVVPAKGVDVTAGVGNGMPCDDVCDYCQLGPVGPHTRKVRRSKFVTSLPDGVKV